jgi:membrane associated rhomboid family serine protease
LSTGITEHRAKREFHVRYSSGQPPRADQPRNNTFGLTGEGKVIVDETTLTFVGKRASLGFGGGPKIALSDIVNVEYNAEKAGFLLHLRRGRNYIVFWMASHDEAEALRAMLPQETAPEFVEDQAAHDRFGKVMSALGQRFYVTPTIIALNVAVFIVMLAAGADLMRPNPAILIRFGSNFGPLTWSGQEWRLLSSAFLHVGIIHLALNMFALYQGGALIERLFGSTRFALIYLLSALSGSVVSGWWDPLKNSSGASGAIFGVYGALLAFLVVRRVDIPPSSLKSISTSTLLFCLYSLVFGAVHPLIDNACHVGGLLGGIIAGVILARPFTIEARAVRQPARLLVALVVIGLPLAWMAQPLVSRQGSQAEGLKFQLELAKFGRIEADLVRRQTDILTFPPNARVNRLEIAKRLREEVLIPWREASRPILQSTTISEQDSPSARLQAAMRNYVRAREAAVALQVLALETADPSDQARATSADKRLAETLEEINVLMRE